MLPIFTVPMLIHSETSDLKQQQCRTVRTIVEMKAKPRTQVCVGCLLGEDEARVMWWQGLLVSHRHSRWKQLSSNTGQ